MKTKKSSSLHEWDTVTLLERAYRVIETESPQFTVVVSEVESRAEKEN